MAYCLLTGATGILGRYLLKDCLLAAIPLAVLIRSSKRETARQRLEALMQYWEGRLGRALPRPVVLEGDLRAADVGLAPQDVRWISRHCDTLLHSAASMTFHADGPDSEPFQTNIGGTRNLLAMCRETGIRKMHHVSTAYVCGLRQGLIREDEIDVGQQLGNDYERSKLQAEKLARAAGFLDSLTVYRPASIIGDSQSGYTTNFHGFYMPLQLVYAMIRSLAGKGMGEQQSFLETVARARFMGSLNLQGHEGKNFVPVDWTSAVIVSILTRPEHHGRTYHLTPRNRVSAQMVRDVIEHVLREYLGLPVDPGEVREEVSTAQTREMERLFQEQMSVYQSHWRDDPYFDYTQTQAAAPRLVCPMVDREMLLRTSRFAVRTNFGWPRPAPIQLEFDAAEHLRPLSELGGALPAATGQTLALEVTGPGGGQWRLFVEQGELRAAERGLDGRRGPGFHLHAQTFAALAARKLNVRQAVNAGLVVIEASGLGDSRLVELMQQLIDVPQAAAPAAH
jgi:thioester reductase-like protein